MVNGFLEVWKENRVNVLGVVPDRSAGTLEPIILQHLLPGTHIISDGWAAYCNLGLLANGIYQLIIVHK